jgi:hypothetical protein
MRNSTERALGVIALLCAPASFAWPVDDYVDVAVGAEKFRAVEQLEWVDVEDPSVVSAEALPSGEVLITGRGPGRTLILAYGEGRLTVFRARVGDKALKLDAEPAKKACPGLSVSSSAVTAKVGSERCWQALLSVAQGDGPDARSWDLSFEVPALQAQLKAIDAAVSSATSSKVTAAYLGATLKLKGEVTSAEQKKILWAAFKNSLGRIALENQLTTTGGK